MMEILESIGNIGVVLAAVLILGMFILVTRLYRKSKQGQALVLTGIGGTKVAFSGTIIIPVLQRLEVMDISLKSIVIARQGKDGLVCKDNMRADIKVAFFVRVNSVKEDVIKVAQSVGCERASSKEALVQLFEAKFSEALKTVGKQFNFVDLYDSRDDLKQKMIDEIGKDLNGYVLDDAAIDYVEQTPIEALDEKNILDAEGIKKITELTATQKMLSNKIERNKEKVITQQDVEAREAILELEKQLAETEERQKREVTIIKAREEAESLKVQQEETLKSERARILTEEEVEVATENKDRQVIVARKNKERIEAIETERVEKDRLLEVNERERVVTLAEIEKEKSIEVERKNIQEVIRDRVAIEKTVVDEEEKIKDTRAFAEAERSKQVAITGAEEEAERGLVEKIKAAEAAKQASEFEAKQKLIEAEADQASAAQKAEAIKIMAEATAAEAAAIGLSEAKVMEAKAAAREKQGEAEASVREAAAEADAKGIELKSEAQAEADQKLGLVAAQITKEKGLADASVVEAMAAAEEKRGQAEATVMSQKFIAEAEGIQQKADAMRKLDGVGKDHEEFKLRLEKEKTIELAAIKVQKDVADAQALVLSEALKNAKIDIVGGDSKFFDQITGSITRSKSIDRLVDHSHVVTDLKDQLLDTSDGNSFAKRIKSLVDQFGVSSEDMKNLSISAILFRMMQQSKDSNTSSYIQQLLNLAKSTGIEDQTPDELGMS